MTETHAQFLGSIPENYDRYLGPALFEPYARDLAGRLEVTPTGRVLEAACGTGIATRQLRGRMPPQAVLVATDLNEPMLEHARRALAGTRGIEWRQADASALPFPDAAFEAVACQFGLMFVPDKAAALKEFRRVLMPGGALVLNVWDSLERNTFGRTAHETIAGFFPVDPPTFYQVPFGMGRPDELRALVAGAGFEGVRIDPVAVEGRSPSAADLARGLVEGNPVINAIRERGGVEPRRVVEAVAAAVKRNFGDDPVRFPLHAFVATARAGAR